MFVDTSIVRMTHDAKKTIDNFYIVIVFQIIDKIVWSYTQYCMCETISWNSELKYRYRRGQNKYPGHKGSYICRSQDLGHPN